MATLDFFVVLATAVFTGGRVNSFFLTAVTKSPPEGFSPITMDGSGSEFIAGAVTLVTLGLPPTAHTASLYDLSIALFAMADVGSSHHVNGT
ncbi:hypothetical protein B7P43_G11220 [Cryptotermes secundus]|uniref:Uncharacterized protein n=1 Tax=Cryptotermes secundus TaxID=105785 RepID=A0A2J7QYT1_9NEOP|nr:hypothetical protein B7P43_G11220 [Cryptotermes secundus]